MPQAAAGPSRGADHKTSAVLHDEAVYVVQEREDGTVHTAAYEPAAGVTPDELRASLRRRGIRGVRDAEPTATADIGTLGCSPIVGTASALCGAKWSYGAYNDPQVYFLDHTSDSWPVSDAQADRRARHRRLLPLVHSRLSQRPALRAHVQRQLRNRLVRPDHPKADI